MSDSEREEMMSNGSAVANPQPPKSRYLEIEARRRKRQSAEKTLQRWDFVTKPRKRKAPPGKRDREEIKKRNRIAWKIQQALRNSKIILASKRGRN